MNFKQQPRCCGQEFDRCSSDAFAVPRAASTTTDPSLGSSGPVLRVNRQSLRNQRCLALVSFPRAGERVLQDEATPEDAILYADGHQCFPGAGTRVLQDETAPEVALLGADGHQVHGPNWDRSSVK